MLNVSSYFLSFVWLANYNKAISNKSKSMCTISHLTFPHNNDHANPLFSTVHDIVSHHGESHKLLVYYATVTEIYHILQWQFQKTREIFVVVTDSWKNYLEMSNKICYDWWCLLVWILESLYYRLTGSVMCECKQFLVFSQLFSWNIYYARALGHTK